eukprot:15265260-Alexandrium_andersonii.AAC.1
MERVGLAHAEEAHLAWADLAADAQHVADETGEPREDDAPSLADQAIDERYPEGPNEIVLDGPVDLERGNESELVGGKASTPKSARRCSKDA